MLLPNLLRRASLLLGMLILVSAQPPKPMHLEQTLRESRWKKRVLLLAAATANDADFKSQKALLAAHQQGLSERDFVVLDVFYNQLSSIDQAYLTQKLGLQPTQFAAVLIGKDGGVKEKSRRPVSPAALFGTVDQMPMRRDEMRKQ